MKKKNSPFQVEGRLVDAQTGKGAPGLRLEAWDTRFRCKRLITRGITNLHGVFKLAFDREQFRELLETRRGDLAFKVFRDAQLIRTVEAAGEWTVDAGATEITIETELPAPGEPTIPAAPARYGFFEETPIRGLLINAAGGYPVGGLRVVARCLPPDCEDGGASSGCVLGETVSGPDGRFQIEYARTAAAVQQLYLLRQRQWSCFVLEVYGHREQPYLVSEPREYLPRETVTLAVPVPLKTIRKDDWKRVGRVMEDNRIAQLHELVRGLLKVNGAQSLFADLDLERRHSMLLELEQGFLDPRGVLRRHAGARVNCVPPTPVNKRLTPQEFLSC